jgi:hypothetical protein
MKVYLLSLDYGVIQRVMQVFSCHIFTMNREREDIWFGFDIKSEK